MILIRGDLLAGFSIPDDAVAVQCFPFRFWDEVSAAVLTFGNIGLGCDKLLKKKMIVLFISVDAVLNSYRFSKGMYSCGSELLNPRIVL